MQITFQLQDLGLAVLIIVGIVLGVYLVKMIKTLNDILRKIQGIVETNETSIEEVISSLPTTIKNVNEITTSVNESMDKIAPTIPNIVDNINDITDTINVNVEKMDSAAEVVWDGVSEAVATARGTVAKGGTYITIVMKIIEIFRSKISKKEKKYRDIVNKNRKKA